MSQHWMIATMTLVGVLAISFSWRSSDTTLSVDWMTEAYAADITAKVIAVLDGDTIEVLHNRRPELICLNGIDRHFMMPREIRAFLSCRPSTIFPQAALARS